ncbi:SDR family NAD(P)-dependent oxidoreductase [Rhodococcus sp. G-MC3]|uniref:SDR family NAD(P)-dependent oxidoreductase n=1 Tax=Rhodococcus sp. G-MC3 TaxID=3046209 RepID=UPI0024B99C14|nr:SDR family NAD(P)-dependent oxidoreductase [Rhodococcus sp. G-MC3]MDJ0396729.1 SDR family NAD(P)-dependent oxidoreductase [Rhodococcus sp. G-MC3]
MKLNTKVAVVTGGAGGLGTEISRELARQGASVAILDRDSVDDIASLVSAEGRKAIQLGVDITSNDEVHAAFEQIEQLLGPVDILVNAAGVTGTSRPTHEATEDDFDTVFAVNVKGTFFCSKYAIQSMLSQQGGGSIVNISSTYGVAANADIPLYHATKAAVIMMAKTDAVTYAADGIRANAIVLGTTRTPMSTAAMSISPEGSAYLQNLIDLHPLKRQAEPDEVAKVVAFLAGPDSSYITASAIPVDGGYTAI